jgi:O-antigen ligase
MGKKKNKHNRAVEKPSEGSHKVSVLPTFIYIVALGALVAPLLPSSAASMPVTMTQAAIFQAAVVLMLALWLPLAITDRRYRPRKNCLTAAVLLFGVMMLASLAFSVDPDFSFWSQLWRMTGVWNMLHYIVWFVVLSSVVRDRRDWRILLAVSCAFALYAGLYGMKQWLASPMSASVRSTLGNQSLLAAYVLPHIFIAAYLYIGSRAWAKWFYGLVMFVGSFTIIVSASRGAVLALVVSAAVTLAGLVFVSKWPKRRRLALSGLALLLPALAVSLVFVLRTEPVKQALTSNTQLPRFVSRVVYRDIGADRKLLWSYAWRGFTERPIFGWGNEQFGYLYDLYFDHTGPDREIFNERWQDRAHNQYLDILVSYGLIGMLTFVLIWLAAGRRLLFAFRTADQEEKKRLAMLVTFCVGYLVYVLTIFDTPAQLMVIFAVLAMIASWEPTEEEDAAEPEKGSADLRLVLLVLLLIGSAYPIWINIAPLFRAVAAQEGLLTLRSDRRDLEGSFAPAFKSPNAYVHGMRYAAVFETQKYMELAQLNDSVMEDGLRYLADQLEQSAAERPYSSRYLIGAATATRMLAPFDPDALDRSADYAQKLIELTPNRFDGYTELAEAKIIRGEYGAAIELLYQAEERIYTKRKDLFGRIYTLLATAHAGRREFDLMFENIRLAEENDPEYYYDARLVMMLARVMQDGDQVGAISRHLDQVEERYGQVPLVRAAIQAIREKMAGN